MPQKEPKDIQQELEQDQVWPVYWICGREAMKSRELLKRIKKTVGVQSNSLVCGEEFLDGSECQAVDIVDAAQTLSLGGGIRFITIRNAEQIKDPEKLDPLLRPRMPKDELEYTCVFLAKDLDKRKKFSKTLIKKSAVVKCDEVAEPDKEAWIDYLAHRRGLQLQDDQRTLLYSVEPWSLDLIDQELAKLELAEGDGAVLLGQLGGTGGTEPFLEALFTRRKERLLPQIHSISSSPEHSIPLLGLIAWNVRQLALFVSAQESGQRPAGRMNPYLQKKLERWAPHWKLDEVIQLQETLSELDFGMKQTARLPIGLWTQLVSQL